MQNSVFCRELQDLTSYVKLVTNFDVISSKYGGIPQAVDNPVTVHMAGLILC